MIHPNVIKRRADEEGLSAPTVERDYVLSCVARRSARVAICSRELNRLPHNRFSDGSRIRAEGALRVERLWLSLLVHGESVSHAG